MRVTSSRYLTATALVVLASCRSLAATEGLADAAAGPASPPPTVERGEADAAAAELAARVIERLGGEEAWERARYVSWLFFGRRRHLWDKHTGDVRIEDENDGYVIRMNLHTGEGRVTMRGRDLEDEQELAAWLERGVSFWVNDSYWMFMPYKLRDPGVTLRHAGRGELADGRPAELLDLTFDGVGLTPENRYRVYVADDTGLVEQWDFYAGAEDAEPRMSTPWRRWSAYRGDFGEIWLAGGRGRGLDWEIEVLGEVPEGALLR